MPYNGTGTFISLSPPIFPAVSNTYILASSFNSTMTDVFTGLSSVLPRDGQAAMTANLPMGNFKVTGLLPGAATGEAVEWNQVFNAPTFNNASLAGIPTAATATLGTATTQLATTAFVMSTAFTLTIPSYIPFNASKFNTTLYGGIL